jgi:hypothetical protein
VAPIISLDQFVETIFAEISGSEVCITVPSPAGQWPGHRYRPDEDHGPSPYVCISSVTPPANARQRRIRRRVEDCRQTPLVVLDDICTKIPADCILLEPTYKLETSAGNFQYGYKVSPPAAPAQASAAIAALCHAGLSDKGATGANRVVRLPGSINTKPGRNNWAARLTSWRPELTYKIEALSEGLGITSGMTSSRPVIKLPTAASDLMLEQLAKRGYVPVGASPNADGWWTITCPWAQEHSDGRDDAKYKPSPHGVGVFYCFHSACRDRGRLSLLQRVFVADPAFRKVIRVARYTFSRAKAG